MSKTILAVMLAVLTMTYARAQSQPQPPALPHSLWIEAEDLGPLKGANYSFQKVEVTTKGSWSIAGPGTAAEWTQGGESGFLSVASRGDEAAGLAIGRDIEVPAAGAYSLWVRYADYQNLAEQFGVRLKQNGKTVERIFGDKAVVDELDQMKLRWNFAFGWDKAEVSLEKGAARIELFTTGPTGARRHVDALCLTTDAAYRPFGREKPGAAAWRQLELLSRTPTTLAPAVAASTLPAGWQVTDAPPQFLWNASEPWLAELARATGDRVEPPFLVDPPLQDEFLKTFRGKTDKEIPIFGHALSSPVPYISKYPVAFAPGSDFMKYLDRHPDKKFALLWNYGEPQWPAGADRKAVRANFLKYKNRFLGLVAGEALSYAYPDMAALEKQVASAKTRAEVLAALKQEYSAALVKTLSDYYGEPITAKQAWADVISCQSIRFDTLAHALGDWGVRRLGHESHGNNPIMGRQLAFMRGAARQFNLGIVSYQSNNMGDSSTIYARESYFFPASSRYILDNNYDAYGGSGENWLTKDYLLYYLAGIEAYYNEQGPDIFWKPGGNSAGDDFPVQLSPKGKIAAAAQSWAAAPRGTQWTPIAFLLDQAHGYGQEDYHPGLFGLDPQWNPALLRRGRHDDSIRGWFNTAYFPAPLTQNEPATGTRQTYVNGIFGDIFDVIVTAPDKTAIAASYPVLIAAGEITLSQEWGRALRRYVQNGGTLVASADQFSGAGAALLDLPKFGAAKEAAGFNWSATKQNVASNLFRYKALDAKNVKDGLLLASTPDGAPLCVSQTIGKGRLITSAISLATGIDDQPTPLSGMLIKHLTQGLLPVVVEGDVEWTLNRLDNGNWLIGLLNNRGVNKPQHGINPTDFSQQQTVTIRTSFGVKSSRERLTQSDITWQSAGGGASTRVTIPAGAVRMVEIVR